MQIKVLFFGATADIVRTHEIALEVSEESSPTSLIQSLSRKHPFLSNHKLLIAVNEEYVDSDIILKDGDEMAIFTAVSGG